MGNSNHYALAALKGKRGSLAGEIAQLKNRLAWAESQLRHVDATIALFEPNLDPDTIPNKRPEKRIKLFRQGELGRLIVDALRTSDGPVRTYDVVSAILMAQGHDENARSALTPRVRSNLQYLQTKTTRVAKIGSGGETRWTISESG